MKQLVLALLLSPILAQSQTLSAAAEISLLTISPGEQLWEFAGHTAIRIHDPASGLDINFNYGTFDFRKSNFILRFLRGTLPYEIGADNSRPEIDYWLNEGRTVTEQVLNLDSLQKQECFDFLVDNYRPENREYMYKFFFRQLCYPRTRRNRPARPQSRKI